jgi:hypothetical protein
MGDHILSYLVCHRFSSDVGSCNENLHILPEVQRVSTTERKGPGKDRGNKPGKGKGPGKDRGHPPGKGKGLGEDRGTWNREGQRVPTTKMKGKPKKRINTPTRGRIEGTHNKD